MNNILKKQLVILLAIGILLIISNPQMIFANENVQENNNDNYINDYIKKYSSEITDIDSYLKESDTNTSFKSFSEITKYVYEGKSFNDFIDIPQLFVSIIKSNFNLIKDLFVLGIISAIIKIISDSFNNSQIKILSVFVVYGAFVLISCEVYLKAHTLTKNILVILTNIYKAVIMVFLPSVMITGGMSTKTAYYEIVIMMIYVVNEIIIKYIVFANLLYVVLGILDSSCMDGQYVKMCCLINKWTKIIMKSIFIFFTGLNGIKSLIIPFNDSIRMSHFFNAVNIIPGLGDGKDIITKEIAGAFVLIKNSIGVAGMIVIALTVLSPLISILISSLIFCILSAIMQQFADERIVKGMEYIGNGISNLLYILLVVFGLMSVTLIIMCASTNISLLM